MRFLYHVVFYALILAIFVGLAVLVNFLSQNPGTVTVGWLNHVVESSVGVLLLAVAAFVLVLLAVVGVLRNLFGLRKRLWRRYQAKRHENGLNALQHSLLASLDGEQKMADKLAKRASRLLERPSLALSVAAINTLTGQPDAQSRLLHDMLAHDETKVFALHGLLKQAVAHGDHVKVYEYASQGHDLKPDDAYFTEHLLEAHIREGRYKEAQMLLYMAGRNGVMPQAEVDALLPAILIARADDMPPRAAEEQLERAYKLAAGYIPAVLAYADLLEMQHAQSGLKILEKAWKRQPHRLLSKAINQTSLGLAERSRFRRLKSLSSAQEKHPEHYYLLAHANHGVGRLPEAVAALEQLAEISPDQEVLGLLAAWEQEQAADPKTALHWLSKLPAAPRPLAYKCNSCGKRHTLWMLICSNCQAVATIDAAQPVAEQEKKEMVKQPELEDQRDKPGEPPLLTAA